MGGQTLQQAVGSLIRTGIGYVGVAGLLAFIYGGYIWMTAGGDSKKAGQSKQIMLWTVIGMACVFGGYVVVNFVITNLVGVTSSNP